MFKATVNNASFDIVSGENGYVINGEESLTDISPLGGNLFSILHKNKSYTAELVKYDRKAKTFLVKVNGRKFEVQVKDQFDQLLEKMGMSAASSARINSIKAPMPGLIIDLKVKDGQAVSQNEPLLILEAMKMENVIKSPADAVVKSVKVQKGKSVEKGQVMIEFE